MSKRGILLDRDDTIIRNIPYLGDPAQVELLPGAREALQRARAAGFRLVVVSNQSGVGRGLITKGQVAAVNEAMERAAGVEFDGIYCCYAAPGDPYGSEERKPSPVLAERAARDLGLDPARSYFIGDRWVDMECGRRAGLTTVLVESGNVDDAPSRRQARQSADHVFPGLAEAMDWILREGDL